MDNAIVVGNVGFGKASESLASSLLRGAVLFTSENNIATPASVAAWWEAEQKLDAPLPQNCRRHTCSPI